MRTTDRDDEFARRLELSEKRRAFIAGLHLVCCGQYFLNINSDPMASLHDDDCKVWPLIKH